MPSTIHMVHAQQMCAEWMMDKHRQSLAWSALFLASLLSFCHTPGIFQPWGSLSEHFPLCRQISLQQLPGIIPHLHSVSVKCPSSLKSCLMATPFVIWSQPHLSPFVPTLSFFTTLIIIWCLIYLTSSSVCTYLQWKYHKGMGFHLFSSVYSFPVAAINNLPQTLWLKTIKMYFLLVLEAVKSRYLYSHTSSKVSRRSAIPCLFQCLMIPCIPWLGATYPQPLPSCSQEFLLLSTLFLSVSYKTFDIGFRAHLDNWSHLIMVSLT